MAKKNLKKIGKEKNNAKKTTIETALKRCPNCNTPLTEQVVMKDSIDIECLKCPKCDEEFYSSKELLRYEILSGKRKDVRKIGSLGNSTIVRIPTKILTDAGINKGDIIMFEKKNDDIIIKKIVLRSPKK
jgi:hypothetical protein